MFNLSLVDLVQLAELLIVSPEFKCSNEILTITAMLSGAPILVSLLFIMFIPFQYRTSGFARQTREVRLMLPKPFSPSRTVTI